MVLQAFKALLQYISLYKMMEDKQKGKVQSHTSIEISDYKSEFMISMIKKLGGVSSLRIGQCCCIYKVHKKFCKINEYAYIPEMISIGPFHCGNENLKAMEDHKLWYMDAFLTRIGNKEAKVRECFEAISNEEDRIRKCYSIPVEPDSRKFIEMMIVDGLFIIELFLRSVGEVTTRNGDPIFNNKWAMPSLVRDLILLENQLPMLVLDNLFSITMGNQGGKSLNELAIRFFNPLIPRKKEALVDYFGTGKHLAIKGDHLLDLLSKTFHDSQPVVRPKDNATQSEDSKLKHVPCVTDLRQAGVKFRKGNDSGNFLDINFTDRVLYIPPIHIQDQTDTLLRNLIASEQCCDGTNTYMTSYAYLMDSLINSSEDVAFLCKKGIIKNYLGENECVASLFNNLCNEVTIIDFRYADLTGLLNAHYMKRRNIWYATLKRQYLRSPWKVIGLGTAFLVAVMTVTAAIFTILSFSFHHS